MSTVYLAVNQSTKQFWRFDSNDALAKAESKPRFDEAYESYRLELRVTDDGQIQVRDSGHADLEEWQQIDQYIPGMVQVEREKMESLYAEHLIVVPEQQGYSFRVAAMAEPAHEGEIPSP